MDDNLTSQSIAGESRPLSGRELRAAQLAELVQAQRRRLLGLRAPACPHKVPADAPRATATTPPCGVAGAAASSTKTDAELVAAQREAERRAGVSTAAILAPGHSIAALVAPHVPADPGMRRRQPMGGNPKIWQHHLTRAIPYRVAGGAWLDRIRALSHYGCGLLPGTLLALGRRLVSLTQRQARGYLSEITIRALAADLALCRDTVCRALAWLKQHGLLDVFNVISRGVVRGKSGLFRRANCYLLTGVAPESPPAPAADIDEHAGVGVPARVTAQLQRWAADFRLQRRPWGLNATPLRRVAAIPPTPS